MYYILGVLYMSEICYISTNNMNFTINYLNENRDMLYINEYHEFYNKLFE